MPAGFRLVAVPEEDGGRRRLRVEVEAASPFFAGHFPGHPILPGIAQLALVAWGEPLAEVRNLRLRRPVGPGDVLDLSLEGPGEDGLLRFDLRRGTDSVSQGTVRIGNAAPAPPFPDLDLPAVASFPSPAALVPHAHPALLIRSVLEAAAGGAACVVEIPAASPFVESGRAPAFLGLEAAAQTAAVLESLARTAGAGPRLGYLVGVRDARLHTPWLPAGRPLRATVRLTGSAPPLAVYEAVIDAGGPELVTGTVSTYVTS